MKGNFLLLVLAMAGTLVSCNLFKPSSNGGGTTTKVDPRSTFNFRTSNSLSKLLDEAARENKLVFVDMWIENCPPCKVMDEHVFTNRDLGAQYSRDFINYKLNGTKDNGPDVAAIYNVFFYPTLLILSPEGTVLGRIEGGASIEQMRTLAREALANRYN